MDDDSLDFTIYIPGDYKTSGKKYPVLYLFHGIASDHTAWNEEGDVVKMTDEAIRNGEIKPFIIVMPNAFNSFMVDGFWLFDGFPGHKFESCFFKMLKPYIEANYPVMTDRAHTAVAGLSMGGYGASLYGFKYPETFCMSYSMSGATEGLNWIWSRKDEGLVPSIETIFREKEYTRSDYGRLPDYYMDCGTEDLLCKSFNDLTHDFLVSIGFPHAFREYKGCHDWDYWKGCYSRMIPDLARHFDQR